jgi:hypothetical protein
MAGKGGRGGGIEALRTQIASASSEGAQKDRASSKEAQKDSAHLKMRKRGPYTSEASGEVYTLVGLIARKDG